ncbi:MAG TPA: U32 family peptidase [Geobacterales bacterium]|nr:U32 family peptidase [Geobacterales bacterium]
MSHQPRPLKKPELLAPAGSLEAFFAAMEKGADAVYAGLRDFSARAKAKNFSLERMERLIAYAHSLNRKVYITLNTLIKEDELPLLVETLSALEAMRVDGVILQDLGVYRLIRDHFPGIPLHASTQMTIHNLAGVQMLQEMGFSRVVLARELHLDDIRQIASKSTVEIECFIHGALCFSISGQCFFSSWLGGHSGNRGRCAQPCRRLFRHRGKEGYYFSTNDFSSIDLIPEMADAGVASLKIEGRMKSAEYVATVVEAYRLAIDANEKNRSEQIGRAKELLKASFGRVPTKGFLVSRHPTDIATPSLQGATGRFLGLITTVRGERISFTSRDRLHVGDRLRIQPKTDMAGRGFTVRELWLGRNQVQVTPEKSMVSVNAPFSVSVGDGVYKVASGTAFTMSEAACERRLASVGPDKLPCSLTFTVNDGRLRIAGEVEKLHVEEEFDLGNVEPGRSSDMAAVLVPHFTRTADTPFRLSNLDASALPALFIPPARLKEIRRSWYALLTERLGSLQGDRREERLNEARQALRAMATPRPASRSELILRLTDPRELSLLRRQGVDRISLPLTKGTPHHLHLVSRRFRGEEDRLIWRLPFVIFDEEVPAFQQSLAAIADAGFRRLEVANLSHFRLARDFSFQLEADYRLFSLNSQALLFWRELGATAATLCIEDDAANMARLLALDLGITRRVILYTHVPVITSRISIKELKGDSLVVSDRGDEYRVTERSGLTRVTPTRPFSLIASRQELQGEGCGSFVIDLEGVPSEDRPRLVDAVLSGIPLRESSDFNYRLGLL